MKDKYRAELFETMALGLGLLGTPHKCLRCGHQWQGRINRRPVLCPVCHSSRWDVPRKAGYSG